MVGNICHLIQVRLFLLPACNQPAWRSQPAAAFPKASCSCLCLAAAPAQRRQIRPLTRGGSFFLRFPADLPLSFRCNPYPLLSSLCSSQTQPLFCFFPLPSPHRRALSALLSGSPPPCLGLVRPLREPAGQEVVGELRWGRQSRPALTKAWVPLHHGCTGWPDPAPLEAGAEAGQPPPLTPPLDGVCGQDTAKGEVPAIVPGPAWAGGGRRGLSPSPPAPRPRTLRPQPRAPAASPGRLPPSPPQARSSAPHAPRRGEQWPDRRPPPEAPGAPRTCPHGPPAGPAQAGEAGCLPPSPAGPALSAQSPQTAPRDAPEKTPTPRWLPPQLPSRSPPGHFPKPPGFALKRDVEPAGHGTARHGHGHGHGTARARRGRRDVRARCPRPRPAARGPTCEPQQDDPAQDVPIHLPAGPGGAGGRAGSGRGRRGAGATMPRGGGRGPGAAGEARGRPRPASPQPAPAATSPQSRPGWRRAAAPCGSAPPPPPAAGSRGGGGGPLRKAAPAAVRARRQAGTARRRREASGGRRRGAGGGGEPRLPETASLRPAKGRFGWQVPLGACRSSAQPAGDPGTFLCNRFGRRALGDARAPAPPRGVRRPLPRPRPGLQLR